MDLSRLELFFAAANSDNFTQAAAKTNVAQTTMSKYIAQLEEELGVRLFYRTTRECSLTEAGHLFYNNAKDLVRDYESLRKQLQQITGNELTIGVFGEFFDLSILSDFRDAHPEIELRVIFDDKETLYDQLMRSRIHGILIPDILVPSTIKRSSIRSVNVLSGDACLFCSKESLDKYGSPAGVITALPYVTKAREKEYHEECRNILRKQFGASFSDVTIVESQAKQKLLVELSQGFCIMLMQEAEGSANLVPFSVRDFFNETLQLYYSVRHTPDSLRTFIDYVNNTFPHRIQ